MVNGELLLLWFTSVDPFFAVFKRPLHIHSTKPMTGFLRDGFCNVPLSDLGNHSVAGMLTLLVVVLKSRLRVRKKQSSRMNFWTSAPRGAMIFDELG